MNGGPVHVLHQMRQWGSELARALVVLALIFLAFAHTPVVAAPSTDTIFTAAIDQSYCGDLSDGGDGAHLPCHACRIGAGADLPPPPAIGVCAPIECAPVAYVQTSIAVTAPTERTAAQPRAPPVKV